MREEKLKEKEIFPGNKTEIIYAGGTISSLATPQGYREGGHAVDLLGELYLRNPHLKDNLQLGKTEVAFTGLSENMDENYWDGIESMVERALERNPKTIIITHGTDSMEQTATRLEAKFKAILRVNGAKVILTGANNDLQHPDTDAWDNLIFALQCSNSNVEAGVYVAFHRKLIPASLVTKEPFNGIEMNFASKEGSDFLEKTRIKKKHIQQIITELKSAYSKEDTNSLTKIIRYRVNKVRTNHQEFLSKICSDTKVVLLTLYHSGTANTENPKLSIADLIKKLRVEKGLVFFGVTENGEPVDLHSYETSVKLRLAGLVPLYDMLDDVAFAKLKLIPNNLTKTQIVKEMLTNKVGEIDSSNIIDEDIKTLLRLY